MQVGKIDRRARGRVGSRQPYSLLVLALIVFGLAGCAIPVRLPAVPQTETFNAEIPNFEKVRYWFDGDHSALAALGKLSSKREIAARRKIGKSGLSPQADFLAISGGGDNGAFAAGLLVGWSDAGTRPEFKLVTGISTGALVAPFAFLGPEYDGKIEEVYTQTSAKNVYVENFPLSIFFGDAFADTAPLRSTIRRHITMPLLLEIADEYEKGRLLLVGTTDLDAQRLVVWDMGAIAAYRSDAALRLFQDILLASAAVPGVFPPVMFDVEVDGKDYQELHVDGGVISQILFYPTSFDISKVSISADPDRGIKNLYVIKNRKLEPEWSSVNRRATEILEKSVNSLIQTQGVGDLYQIYVLSERDGINFNLAFIDNGFAAESPAEFDVVYMRKLFDYARDQASNGYAWKSKPPGLLKH